MRRRNSYIWALGASLVATVLGFSGRASQSVVAETNSVPSPALSKAYVESAALCEILLTQSHGCTHTLPTKAVSVEFRSIRIKPARRVDRRLVRTALQSHPATSPSKPLLKSNSQIISDGSTD